MSFIRQAGVETVVLVRNPGTEDEQRLEIQGHIQAEKGFFAIDTPIYEGDIVEVNDPRGGIDRRLASRVKINNVGSVGMRHTAVTWGHAPTVRAAPVRRLTIDNLHAEVIRSAGELFADGHYASAILEAFKSLELRVKAATGKNLSGKALMEVSFSPGSPLIDVSMEGGQSGKDEQDGFMRIFAGAMLGIRNPKAHEAISQIDPQRTLEYLGLASLLHRRLDDARSD